MYKKLTMVLGVFALLLFVACEPAEPETPIPEQIPEEDPFIPDQQVGQGELDDLPEVVASLDGVDITREEVSAIISQARASGQAVSPEQAVNQIVVNKVLEAEAEDRGVEAEEGLIEKLLLQDLENQGLTKEDLEMQGISFDDAVIQQEAMMSSADFAILALIEDEKETRGIDNMEAEQRLLQLANQKISESDFELFIEPQDNVQEQVIEIDPEDLE